MPTAAVKSFWLNNSFVPPAGDRLVTCHTAVVPVVQVALTVSSDPIVVVRGGGEDC